MGDQVSRMPSWKASALAEFRVTVLGASGLWTVDLKLYLETFEGYTNRVYLGRNNLLSWVERGCRGGSRDAKERLLFFGPLWPPSGWGGCAYRVCLMLLCIISVTLGSWILPWGCWQGWCWLQYRLQWPLHPTLGFGVFLGSPQFLGSQSFFLVWAPWPPQRWKCHVNSFGNTFSN